MYSKLKPGGIVQHANFYRHSSEPKLEGALKIIARPANVGSIIMLTFIGLRKPLVIGQLNEYQFSLLFIGQPVTHLRHHSV